MAWALWRDDQHRAAKLHVGFEILKGTPAWLLWTGRKLNRSTFRMIQFYLSGWADEEELQSHLDRRPPRTTQS